MESPEIQEHVDSGEASLDIYELMKPLDVSLLGHDQSKFMHDS